MGTKTKPHKSIEEVEKLFKTWRRTRKHYKPIPAELLEAAKNLTADYSIPTIAKRLLIEPEDLKKCVPTPTCTQPSDIEQLSAPAFIEFEIGSQGINYECKIEMEEHSGSKMTMHFKDTRSMDLYALCRSFWNKQP